MPSLWGKLRVFSDAELFQLHQGALRILEEVGVAFQHPQFLERLAAAESGVKIDFDTCVVKFPPEVVEEAMRTARLVDRRVRPPQVRLQFSAEGGPTSVIDLETGRRRPSTLQDLADAVRLADALPNIDGVGEPVTPADVHPHVWDLFMYKTIWSNTFKVDGGGVMGRKGNIIHNRDPRAMRLLLEMGAVMRGGWEELRQRPLIGANMPPQSPLRYDEDVLQQVLFMLDAGQYVTVCSNAMGAAQAPATLAGILALDNAERLAGLTAVTLISPRTEIFIGNHPGYMDLRTGNFSDGSPEHALLALGGHELLTYYGVHLSGHHPVLMTLAKTIGVQAAAEKSALAMLWGLMGATGVCCSGSHLYSYSLAQMVIDNEIAGMVNRILEGFEINEETLALDVIKEVGVGGVFLTHPHTAIESRRNFWASELFDRNTYDSWLARGGRDIIEIATEKARAILATHHPRPLSDEQMAAMEDICERAKAEILQGQRSRTSGTREPASAM